MPPFIRGAMLLAVVAGLAGCGTAPPCTSTYVLTVAPQSGTADHLAAPPGNQVHFQGMARAVASGPSCAVPALVYVEYANWANPDPTDIKISSAGDSSNGTAVCLGTTKGAVTLTGTFSMVGASGSAGSPPNAEVETVTLTCQ